MRHFQISSKKPYLKLRSSALNGLGDVVTADVYSGPEIGEIPVARQEKDSVAGQGYFTGPGMAAAADQDDIGNVWWADEKDLCTSYF